MTLRARTIATGAVSAVLTAAMVAVPMTGAMASSAPAAVAPRVAGPSGYADPVDGTTGTPLGGFGAGAVKFDAKSGTFAATTQAPADQRDYTKAGASRFQFFATAGGETGTADTMKARSDGGRTVDDAIWPEHLVDFGTNTGVSASLKAFSPMDDVDYDAMSLPYAFYEMTLTNTNDTDASAAVALLWDHPASTAPAAVPEQGFSSDQWAVYADSTDTDAIVSAGNDAGFFAGGVSDGAPSGTANRTSVKVDLAPQESTTVKFVLAWYDEVSDPDGAYYLGLHDSVEPIAELGLLNFDRLKGNADTFLEKMRGSNVPSWFLNQTINSLVNVSNNSIYKKDGRTAFAEGEWTTFGTMDQMWHAREVMYDMFPTFAWQELDYWARTQRLDGQIHHDFNYMADTTLKYKLVGWDDTEHADYRNVDKWVDLNAGFIVSVYEAYQATGDEERLAYFWPHMKRAGQRIFDQVELYGDPEHPFTFEDSENSYDAGGDPNAFNSSMSAVAYEIMTKLADKSGETELAAEYQTAYDTVVESYREKYLTDNFPVGRISESYFAGQWLSLTLKLGEIWTAEETDYVLEQLDSYYHPLYWGLGNTNGTYDEWTPYLLSHYGGLLLNTSRENQFAAMQKDSYNRQFLNRNNVFNHPLDVLPAVKTVNYNATSISGDKQYISIPSIWRNYDDMIGYDRDNSTDELWVTPKLLPEMEHVLTNGAFQSPEGYGTISYTETGETFQNQELRVTSDNAIPVSTLHLQDGFGEDTSSIEVTIDGEPVEFTRSGEGYAKELLIAFDGSIDSDGVEIVATGDPGAAAPADPEKPEGGGEPPVTAEKSAFSPIEGEAFTATGGVTKATEGDVEYLTEADDQDYARFDGVGFDQGAEAITLTVRSTKESQIEFALGSVSDAAVATLAVPNTAGEWQKVTIDLPEPVTGTHNAVFRFRSTTGDSSALLDLDRFVFQRVGYKTTLDRSVWTATSNSNGNWTFQAFDDNPSTRWNTSFQKPGDFFALDTGSVQSFSRIVLDDSTKSPQDFPRGYEVYVSQDGTDYGQPIATGVGTVDKTEITFPTQTARYIKIVNTGTEPTKYWSIEEMHVYIDPETEPGDPAALQAALDEAAALVEADYTAETWAPFAEAVTAATAVVSDAESSQEELDAALAALTAARDALVAVEEPGSPDPVVDRIGGADRYEVSVNASKVGFPDGSSTVYLASGQVFPDALSAAPAAAADAPILLTTAATVPGGVLAEIERLSPENIVIVGGTTTVSPAVESSLASFGEVTRIGGSDRYEASRNIAAAAFADGSDTVVLAAGTKFADALSAGAAIGADGPVVLVKGEAAGLDAATRALLTESGVTNIVIAGGPESVSASIEADAASIADTVRLGGADRYEASRAINAHFFSEAEHVLLATGEKFPDALSGSSLAPRLNAPLFTVSGSCITADTLTRITELGATKVTLLGGPATLSAEVESLTACD